MKGIFLIHVIAEIRNWTSESLTIIVTVTFIKITYIIQVGACFQYLSNVIYEISIHHVKPSEPLSFRRAC